VTLTKELPSNLVALLANFSPAKQAIPN